MTWFFLNKKGSFAALFLFCSVMHSAVDASDSLLYSHHNLDAKLGQAIFEKLWVFAPASTKSSDGLGPLYNARSCQQCHDLSRQAEDNVPASLVIQVSIQPPKHSLLARQLADLNENGFIPEPSYGKQLQTFAYPGAKSEADISISTRAIKVIFPDGEVAELLEPRYQFTQLGYGDLHPDFRFSPRIAPRMLGLQLLEAIPQATLLAFADPEDSNKDGISGKVNWVWDKTSGTKQVGRFGWKASKPSLEQQNLAALSIDIGVSSWLFPNPEGDCTSIQSDCRDLATSTQTHLKQHQESSVIPEASREMTDLLLRFTETMTQQSRTITQAENSDSIGQSLFIETGCQQCHRSTIQLGQSLLKLDRSEPNNAMMPQQISPYTDLLLHDMGAALADHRQEFDASGSEWRTAPLWGIANYLKQDSLVRFLHDGRARSIQEAILWHSGEAETSKLAFMALPKKQRIQLMKFVGSL